MLSGGNDPFYAGRGARRAEAQWFADLWAEFGFGPGTHLRRVHYNLLSHAVQCVDGSQYQNSFECWSRLLRGSRDARYLGLVAAEDIVDHRNGEVIEHFLRRQSDAALSVDDPEFLWSRLIIELGASLPEPPDYSFTPACVDQRYLVEIWTEKSTINDILAPIARQFRANILPGPGETSATRCHELMRRARRDGMPVRILYISDFDPGGMSMPVAAARKIEFYLRRDAPDLDVQVNPIALTHEQCVRYRLPRIPLKETERRAAAFEERFGEGATELDALEALHPGVLGQIIRDEIARYYDDDLDDRIEQEADAFRGDLDEAREAIIGRHAAERQAIERAYSRLRNRMNPELRAIMRRYSRSYQAIVGRFQRLQETIAEELADEAPDVGGIDWPEPDDGDEDDDPLFNSTRDYVKQVDRFKAHQGKPTTRKNGKEGAS